MDQDTELEAISSCSQAGVNRQLIEKEQALAIPEVRTQGTFTNPLGQCSSQLSKVFFLILYYAQGTDVTILPSLTS